MEQTLPLEGGRAGSFPLYLCSARSLLSAAGGCLLAVLLVFFSYGYKQSPDAEKTGLETVRFVQAVLGEELQGNMTLAHNAAIRLAGLKTDAAAKLAGQEFILWPSVRLALYDERGGLLGGASSGSAAASPASIPAGVFTLVQKALRGQASVALIAEEGTVIMAAAAPVPGAGVGCVVAFRPLAMPVLLRIKERTHADVAVLLPDMAMQDGMIATFDEARESLSSQSLLQALSGKTEPVQMPIRFADGERTASVCLASGEQGADAAILVVVPDGAGNGIDAASAASLPSPDMEVILLALAGALAVFTVFSYFQFQRERRYRSTMASELTQFATTGRLPVQSQLPSALQGALGAIAGDLQKYKAIAGKASEDRDVAQRRLERLESGRAVASAASEYRTFFADADTGFFLMRENGAILQVNTSFAVMLGYDSPVHLLSEHSALPALCRNAEEGTALLALLCETPHRKFVATLRRRDGSLYEVTASSLAIETAADGSPGAIAGMIVDRALEEQNNHLLWENKSIRKRGETLALLLAATCRQVQAYILPGIPAEGQVQSRAAQPLKEGGAGADCAPAALPELPASVKAAGQAFGFSVIDRICAEGGRFSLARQSIFDDVYHIALEEAQEGKALLAPMNVADILESACLQALPMLQEGGTALFREVEKDLALQVSGSAVVLRHALLRVLLEVAGAMREGHAFLSVVRDPNSPLEEGRIKLLFSASWTSELANEEIQGMRPEDGRENEDASPDRPKSAAVAFSKGDLGFSLEERRNILLFLVQKMHGELLQSSFTEKTRSVQFTAQFETAMAGSSVPSASGDRAAAMRNFGLARRGGSPVRISAVSAKASGVQKPLASLHEEDAGVYASIEDPLDSLDPLGGSGYDSGVEAPLAAEEDAVVHLLNMDPGMQEDEEEPGVDDSLDILLIDDSMNNRLLFSMFLRDTRHRITEAHNGQEGVEAFQNQRFDVIFMDMEMPLMNGYQATRIIRAMEADAGMAPTPIVAQTAHVLPDFKYQCMLAGCTEFLAKPFSKNALLTMVKAFSRLKRERMRAAGEAAE